MRQKIVCLKEKELAAFHGLLESQKNTDLAACMNRVANGLGLGWG
jgi:hypothetical protein